MPKDRRYVVLDEQDNVQSVIWMSIPDESDRELPPLSDYGPVGRVVESPMNSNAPEAGKDRYNRRTKGFEKRPNA